MTCLNGPRPLRRSSRILHVTLVLLNFLVERRKVIRPCDVNHVHYRWSAFDFERRRLVNMPYLPIKTGFSFFIYIRQFQPTVST
jgi:hypothetical protein